MIDFKLRVMCDGNCNSESFESLVLVHLIDLVEIHPMLKNILKLDYKEELTPPKWLQTENGRFYCPKCKISYLKNKKKIEKDPIFHEAGE